ncbi:hypothetical protein QR680_016045 [Steinernema hermaphroditum]|uniref:Glycosyltransferase family 92 protein n=1 Tax=Steinernema hermaphroditum TaxID=289476 RepID=A0AA39HA41_9BILA|nr:hypothetical protein QR680_016045 [Steinernema hermaphroditum]
MTIYPNVVEEDFKRLDFRAIGRKMKQRALRCPGHTACEWCSYRWYAEIPAYVNLPENVHLISERRMVKVRVTKSVLTKRREGIAVCVSPLYYFNNWVRVVEFIEIYRNYGVQHFYIYVLSVSKIVYSVLQYYEKQGMVSIIEWTELPKIGDIDPNKAVFRVGQGADHVDCLMRSSAKYVAALDFDDYITISNGTILDYITREEENDPTIGSFNFLITLVRPQKFPFGDVDWHNYDFNHLIEAEICDTCNREFKTIMIADKVDIPFTHFVVKHRQIDENTEYRAHRVSTETGSSRHARYYYVEPVIYDSKFKKQTFIEQPIVESLRNAFKKILRRLMGIHRNLRLADTSDYMNNCSRYVLGVCQTPLHTCTDMEELEDWKKFERRSQFYIL